MKFNKLAVAVTSAVLLMAGNVALADSTSDIVNVLVDKGILTPEEGKLISKNSVDEKKKAQKEAGKIKISEAIDSLTLYGDVRVRLEDREVTGLVDAGTKQGSGTLTRFRGKFLLGMTATSGDFYTDFALSTGGKGRSDNYTMGQSGTIGSGLYAKGGDQAIAVNRAMIGWKLADWITVEAGRMKNPLYTTQMVWDADLPVEGLTEKLSYNYGGINLFANLGQYQYEGVASAPNYYFNDGSAGKTVKTIQLFATQVGLQGDITSSTNGKAAVTYYSYNNGDAANGTASGGNLGVFTPMSTTGSYNSSVGMGVNNLSVVEVPAEINYMAFNNVGVRFYGDYAVNLTAQQRANAAGYKGGLTVARGDNGNDYAYLAGIVVGSAPDLKSFAANKMKQGDWQARLWYQEIGMWSIDPNAVDSDFMDGRVNTKGWVAKAQYNLRDNVMVNLSGGYGQVLDKRYGLGGYGDMTTNFSHLGLVQTDLTWKF